MLGHLALGEGLRHLELVWGVCVRVEILVADNEVEVKDGMRSESRICICISAVDDVKEERCGERTDQDPTKLRGRQVDDC